MIQGLSLIALALFMVVALALHFGNEDPWLKSFKIAFGVVFFVAIIVTIASLGLVQIIHSANAGK
jgi:hypothetical protein